MAAKLDLLLLFQTGQGIAGGLSEYVNYPQDHDSNYTAIQTTVNQMVDELAATRASDNAIPIAGILTPDHLAGTSRGRFSPQDARISFSGDEVTIAAGDIWVGRRYTIPATTFTGDGSSGTRYLNIDSSGVPALSETASAAFFDVAELTWNGSAFTSIDADNLDPSGGDDVPLITGKTANLIQWRGNGDAVESNLGSPSIRLVDEDGNLEDAGFAHRGTSNSFAWVSGNSGGSPVVAARHSAGGQFLLMEQARVFVQRTTNQSIGTGSMTGVIWDSPAANSFGAPERREPESYDSTAFISSATASLVLPSSAQYDGTYHFTAYVVLAANDETYVDAQIIQTVGGSAVIARQRVAASPTETVICLSGMYDLEGTDAFQLQIEHNGSGSQNVTEARLTAMLVGGPVASA